MCQACPGVRTPAVKSVMGWGGDGEVVEEVGGEGKAPVFLHGKHPPPEAATVRSHRHLSLAS